MKIVAPDLRVSTKFHITEHIFDFRKTLGQILANFSTHKGGTQKKNVPVHKYVRVKIVAPDLRASTKFHITEHIFDFGKTLGQILANFSTHKGGPQKKMSLYINM